MCLHGLSGEVLAEVPHDVEGVHGGGGEDASGSLVAQICQWVGGLAGWHRDEEEEVIGQEGGSQDRRGGARGKQRTFVSKLKV